MSPKSKVQSPHSAVSIPQVVLVKQLSDCGSETKDWRLILDCGLETVDWRLSEL
jgi:hypothetical protein